MITLGILCIHLRNSIDYFFLGKTNKSRIITQYIRRTNTYNDLSQAYTELNEKLAKSKLKPPHSGNSIDTLMSTYGYGKVWISENYLTT